MGYIITNDQYYRDIATAIRSKMLTDREYAPSEMASAVANIPSSADGTDEPITGIYYLNPDSKAFPTVIKVCGWKLSSFPLKFGENDFTSKVEKIEFISCNIETMVNSEFSGIVNLNSIVLPDSLIEIPQFAFYYCTNLKEVIVPNNVQKIKDVAFCHCDGLKTIYIPSSITQIFGNSFQYCGSLEFVILADGFDANNLNLSSSTKYSLLAQCTCGQNRFNCVHTNHREHQSKKVIRQ